MTLVLMLIGAFLAGSDYGLACNGWPLCNGEVVPDVGATSVLVHYVHRVLALLLGMWKGRQTLLPWAVAAVVAVVAHAWLPGKWYIVIGGLCGSIVALPRSRAATRP